MSFTAHNVRLSDGSETMPEQGWLLADTPTCVTSIKVLRLALGRDLTGKSIVDLGCLEGGYTAEFAKAGMDTLGIEARQSNLDNCKVVSDGLGLPNLKFVRDDVMNIANYGTFDATYCNGLLYHLDKPKEFILTIAKQTKKVIIVHTHYAMEEIGPTFKTLSEMTENEGMRGRWFIEHTATTDEEAEQFKWSSWKNHKSFWPTKPELIGLLHEGGFDMVFEQFDWIQDVIKSMTSGSYKDFQRTMIVGIKSDAIA